MGEPRISEPILVTGATGFIGRRLIARCIEEEYRPRVFALPGDAIPNEWQSLTEIVRGDVADEASVTQATQGVKTVVHLAATVGDWGSQELFERVTIQGTKIVLGAAAKSGARALLASSVVVYGDAIGRDICTESHPFGSPLGHYGRSKQAQETIALQLEASLGLKVTIIRPTNVYGPGSAPWVDKAAEQLRAGAPALIGGGHQIAGLTYVDNVVDVFLRAAARIETVGRIYNANDDNNISWRRYFSDLARLCGASPPKAIPRWLGKLAASSLESSYRLLRIQNRPMITHEALNLVGSHHRVPITKARRELGYEPRINYQEAMTAIGEYLEQKES